MSERGAHQRENKTEMPAGGDIMYSTERCPNCLHGRLIHEIQKSSVRMLRVRKIVSKSARMEARCRNCGVVFQVTDWVPKSSEIFTEDPGV